MINPKEDVKGAKTDITVMSIAPITNTLEKGQENGDATKVMAGNEIIVMGNTVPVIDTKTENHIVTLGGRRLPDGTIMKKNLNTKRKELQEAIIAEQKEQILQEER